MSRRPSTAPILPPDADWSLKRPVRIGPSTAAADLGSRHATFRPTADSRQPTASTRRGLTLIEMLVALAVTLVMMAAVVNLFANISGSIRNRRAVIEVSGQLRQVRARLALDLAGATWKGGSWLQPAEKSGYIEIIEGEWNDANPSILIDGVDPPTAANPELDYVTSLVPSGGNPAITASYSARSRNFVTPVGAVTNGGGLGDWDDILALTVQSETEPFKAQVGGTLIQSNRAEVIWFAAENDLGVSAPLIPGMRRIYRRVFLIAPTLGPWNVNGADPDLGRPANVSVRYVPDPSGGAGQWVANDIADLGKRENRAMRHLYPFPHVLIRDLLFQPAGTMSSYMVLEDALAFDVRLYDPGAPLFEAASGNVVQPGDPGWFNAIGPNPVGFGAYCDLGWAWAPPAGPLVYTGAGLAAGIPLPRFNELRMVGWHPRALNAGAALREYPCVYDTWSPHYENDGQDQELTSTNYFTEGIEPPIKTEAPRFAAWQNNTIDQGVNGLDDDGINGTDDPGERETSPPYDVPLRGVKVSLRIYERDARQIRETSVTHSFAQ